MLHTNNEVFSSEIKKITRHVRKEELVTYYPAGDHKAQTDENSPNAYGDATVTSV